MDRIKCVLSTIDALSSSPLSSPIKKWPFVADLARCLSNMFCISSDDAIQEMKKIQASTKDQFQKIYNDHEKLKMLLESEKRNLEMRGQELEKREAPNETEKKKLQVDIEKNSQKNSSLQHAALEQQRADENVLMVAEEQNTQKEALHKRIIDLQQQLEVKQKLELEIEQLKGHLNVIKHVPDEDDKVDATMKDWRDLIVNEKRSNGELQDARKELIHPSNL